MKWQSHELKNCGNMGGAKWLMKEVWEEQPKVGVRIKEYFNIGSS